LQWTLAACSYMRAPVYCLTQWVSSREGCLCTPAPPCEVHRIHTVRIYLTGRGAHTTGGGASSMLLDAILSSTGGGPSKDASAPRPPCSFHQITVLSQYQTADLGSPSLCNTPCVYSVYLTGRGCAYIHNPVPVRHVRHMQCVPNRERMLARADGASSASAAAEVTPHTPMLLRVRCAVYIQLLCVTPCRMHSVYMCVWRRV
jgi:hypothetical protein